MEVATAKRLKNEMKILNKNKCEFYQVVQDDENPLTFYFLLKGDSDSVYNGGYFIGKIMIPETYPQKAGDYMMLTPNGRFVIDKKICLSNSGYHPESWSPCWTLQSMMVGFSSIFLDDNDSGIGHIKKSAEEREYYAQSSINFNNMNYFDIFIKFDQFVNPDGTIKTKEEQLRALEKKKKKKSKEEKKEEIET